MAENETKDLTTQLVLNPNDTSNVFQPNISIVSIEKI